ncbi:MAG: DUF6079 family protein, partial [Candidatus Margulisiibacteriota bacterium]
MQSPLKQLRDIIELSPVKLVIELDDADRNPAEITSSFIPTPDVVDGLRVILGKIKQATGCGIFIKGNFGSGKSHLLSYIYILLTLWLI